MDSSYDKRVALEMAKHLAQATSESDVPQRPEAYKEWFISLYQECLKVVADTPEAG